MVLKDQKKERKKNHKRSYFQETVIIKKNKRNMLALQLYNGRLYDMHGMHIPMNFVQSISNLSLKIIVSICGFFRRLALYLFTKI